MSAQFVTWSQTMSSLGDAVIAIGVFDGVHIGHQSLLRDAVAEAAELDVAAIVVTFDRDPDQVVAPETAAPQLLTLADKLAFIAETGVDSVLVIPFTLAVAEMAPEAFLDSVLLTALRPLAVHVGSDFRFGSRATGEVGTLERFGRARGFRVVGHELVTFGGAPVTSTRIRRLVAGGDVAEATELLGRSPRVSGMVRRGRGGGATLGFATANVTPEPYAALPADGVYAGRAIVAGGAAWTAAISVGTPPSFPEARDYLEAHLIDFEGDLYDQSLTLEFFARIRGQQAFSSLPELTAAIADDVARALEIAGFDTEEDAGSDSVWVPVLNTIDRAAICSGAHGFMLAAPLEAAGIPYVWDPYPPEDRPSGLPGGGAFEQPFTLLVPESRVAEAHALIAEAGEPDTGEVEGGVTRSTALCEDSELWIDDPALLEAAEEAVRTQPAQRAVTVDWDSWIPLLVEQPYDRRRLLGLQHALEAAGIPVKWDPFSPTETPLLKRGFFHQDRFTLAVPSDRLDEARRLIEVCEVESE